MLRLLLPVFFALLLCCAGCAGIAGSPGLAATPRLSTHEFRFADGGRALYFVIDKGPRATNTPRTLMFVVPGSDCLSMAPFLPQYFDGLDGAGALRIFILHKRFIGLHDDGRNCSAAYTAADHPSRWLADQSEFIEAQLEMAAANGERPKQVVALGISEGGEVVPLLARRFARISHLVIVANGGLNPADSLRLQAQRHGFADEAEAVRARCANTVDPDSAQAAGRSCRYWNELYALDPNASLMALELPILVAMGEGDALVAPDSARLLARQFERAGKQNLQLLLFPGANHALEKENISLLPYIWEALDRMLVQ